MAASKTERRRKTSTKAKRSRGPGDGSKSDFIRKAPPTMPAKDVVAAAAAQGMTISAGLVYNVRGRVRNDSGGATPREGGGGGNETELKRAALAVGFPRALEVVAALQRKYNALLRD